MASTLYTDFQAPAVTAAWLNDVNAITYGTSSTTGPVLKPDLAASTGAGLVGFVQAGTGAVARTVQSKESESVSVLDFYANGVSGAAVDPTGAIRSDQGIQTALNLGGKVYIPKGTYRIDASLTVPSNTEVVGEGAATIIQIHGDALIAFTTGYGVSAKENIYIHDLLIDGGGQTTNINTGYKAGNGIYGSRVKNLHIDNVTIRKMGIVQLANPTIDNGWGGYGIKIEARYGSISNIKVTNCTITNIAGQGMSSGDGIYIAGYAPGVGYSKVTAIIENCWVSTCGRDCISLCGGVGETIATSIQITNCYLEKSFSSGLDLEEACDVTTTDCEFYLCGNDQTYGNPLAVFGSTYRLMCGLATGGESHRLIISNNRFTGCYYGMTEGYGNGLLVSNCVFNLSTVSDYNQGLAAGAVNVKLINCQFNTALSTLSRYDTTTSYFTCLSCSFEGSVLINGMLGGTFDSCTFKRGFVISSGGSGFSNNNILNCTFTGWAGVGLSAAGANHASQNCSVRNCNFVGGGSMTSGILFGYDSARNWSVSNNFFSGCTTAGIYSTNTDGRKVFSASGNTFTSCLNGISLNQGISYSAIDNNKFYGITGTCITITNISNGADLIGTSICHNVADTTSVNGVVIAVSTGAIDWCIITNNNMHGPTGTKWSVSTGNSNGISTGNLIT